jgi:hypothetical protein
MDLVQVASKHSPKPDTHFFFHPDPAYYISIPGYKAILMDFRFELLKLMNHFYILSSFVKSSNYIYYTALEIIFHKTMKIRALFKKAQPILQINIEAKINIFDI